MEVIIEQIPSELTWTLRQQVLYPSEELSAMRLAEDSAGIHFGAFTNGRLTGVVSLFEKVAADFQFRQLAVDPAFQRSGIGTALLKKITEFSREAGGKRIWCNSRSTAAPFYVKNGFHSTGRLFSRNGIDYQVVEKKL